MVEEVILNDMLSSAWIHRERAVIYGKTKVGCSVLANDGAIYSACNVEHRYRCHDIHAEVNALTTMIAAGAQRALVIAIVADRALFTPCGACMDWIMQFGGGECVIVFQAAPGGPIHEYRARELMPFYPE